MLFYFLLFIYFGVPLITVVHFIFCIIRFKKTDKTETELRKSRKKKVILSGILLLIFIGGMLITPMMISHYILSHM